MKKLLSILMVIAMVSFLFVGCMPAVTPDVDDEEDEEDEEVAAAKTDTPYITGVEGISILSSLTQYINAETDGDFAVTGVGVAGAIIKLYIDDVYAGIGYTAAAGTFTDVGITAITMAEGADKTVHVTATLPGLAESDASTVYTFTYDKTTPTIASVIGDSTNGYITVTFSEAVASATGPSWRYISSAAYTASITVAAGEIPGAITAPSTTTVRLTENATAPLTADEDLIVGDYLLVLASGGSCADLAGNLFSVPVLKQGFVIEGE